MNLQDQYFEDAFHTGCWNVGLQQWSFLGHHSVKWPGSIKEFYFADPSCSAGLSCLKGE